MNYNTDQKKIEGQVFFYRPYPAEMRKRKSPLTIVLVSILIALIVFSVYVITAQAEDTVIRCWVLCKPGDRVNLRMEPRKGEGSTVVGWLECGDNFQTDGTSKDGWIRVLDRGDCECWIYCGYVVTEEPVAVFENYVCVARKWVACRRWVDGPQIDGRLGWLHNGSDVSVFYIAGDWAVTSRGYIRSEWLEVNPV